MRPNWFIGLAVSPDPWFEPVTAALEVAPQRRAALRLFHPDDLHLTIAFLGAVSEEGARAAWEASTDLAFETVDARLERLEPMGQPRRPTVLAVAVASAGAHRFIAAHRDTLLDKAGARPDRRAPRPHVTVARFRRRADDASRNEVIDAAAAHPPLDTEMTLSHLALYTWADARLEGAPPSSSEPQFRKVAMRELSR
ncbi:MAG: RNA 2',3'-cyclic phosphodiesterase [Myxococcota bacterium]